MIWHHAVREKRKVLIFTGTPNLLEGGFDDGGFNEGSPARSHAERQEIAIRATVRAALDSSGTRHVIGDRKRCTGRRVQKDTPYGVTRPAGLGRGVGGSQKD